MDGWETNENGDRGRKKGWKKKARTLADYGPTMSRVQKQKKKKKDVYVNTQTSVEWP